MPTKPTDDGTKKRNNDGPKQPPNDLERWRDAAAAIPQTDNPLKLPYEDALREAGAVAGFVEKYWAKTTDRPGLSRVPKRVPQTMPEEIRSLVAGTQMAQTALLLVVDPVVASKGDRARFLVNELESHIEFLLDDDVEEPADKQLEQLQAFHADDGQRSAPLAQGAPGLRDVREEPPGPPRGERHGLQPCLDRRGVGPGGRALAPSPGPRRRDDTLRPA